MFDQLLTHRIHLINCENSGLTFQKNLWQPTKIIVYEAHDLFFPESWHLDITDLCTGLDGGEGLTRNASPQQGNRSKSGPRFGPWTSSPKNWLVGGWTNPSEKYARQIGLFPQVGMKNKKYLKPPTSWVYWSMVVVMRSCSHASLCLCCKFAGLVLPVVVDAVHR